MLLKWRCISGKCSVCISCSLAFFSVNVATDILSIILQILQYFHQWAISLVTTIVLPHSAIYSDLKKKKWKDYKATLKNQLCVFSAIFLRLSLVQSQTIIFGIFLLSMHQVQLIAQMQKMICLQSFSESKWSTEYFHTFSAMYIFLIRCYSM